MSHFFFVVVYDDCLGSVVVTHSGDWVLRFLFLRIVIVDVHSFQHCRFTCLEIERIGDSGS